MEERFPETFPAADLSGVRIDGRFFCLPLKRPVVHLLRDDVRAVLTENRVGKAFGILSRSVGLLPAARLHPHPVAAVTLCFHKPVRMRFYPPVWEVVVRVGRAS